MKVRRLDGTGNPGILPAKKQRTERTKNKQGRIERIAKMESKTKPELIALCKKHGIKGYSSKNKPEIKAMLYAHLLTLGGEVMAKTEMAAEKATIAAERAMIAADRATLAAERATNAVEKAIATATATGESSPPPYTEERKDMNSMTRLELIELCKKRGKKRYSAARKAELILMLLE